MDVIAPLKLFTHSLDAIESHFRRPNLQEQTKMHIASSIYPYNPSKLTKEAKQSSDGLEKKRATATEAGTL